MSEQIFFDADGVKVTNARFIVANQTYAMNGVTSVKNTVVPANHTFAIILIVIGVLMLIGGGGGGAKFIGLLLAAAGGFMIYANKATHAVMLHSASGETQALTSKDEPYIASVVEALNQSLIHRG